MPTPMDNLKQTRLDFTAAKRTALNSKVAKAKASPEAAFKAVDAPKETTIEKRPSLKTEKSYDDIALVSSSSSSSEGEETWTSDASRVVAKLDEKKQEVTSSGGRTMRSSARSKLSKKPSQVQEDSSPEPVTVGVFRVSNARPEEVAKKVETNVRNEESRELPELKPKDPKWRKHYNEVKNKMGNLPAIHGEQQNRIHEILRVFDNSYEYGPCVGVPRLERWNRAKALGLTPPKEVEEILKTKQGSTMPEYTESVFYGEV